MCDPSSCRPYEINRCIIEVLKILKKYKISVAERCEIREQIENFLITTDQLGNSTEEKNHVSSSIEINGSKT